MLKFVTSYVCYSIMLKRLKGSGWNMEPGYMVWNYTNRFIFNKNADPLAGVRTAIQFKRLSHCRVRRI